jgi:hypothetical protein
MIDVRVMYVELLPEADFCILATLVRTVRVPADLRWNRKQLWRELSADTATLWRRPPQDRKSKNLVVPVPAQAYSMNTRAAVRFGTGSYVSLLRADSL